MRNFVFLSSLLVTGSLLNLSAAVICPSTSNTNSDCGYLITIDQGGILTGMAVPGASAYDGADDALVGVINNSGAVFSGNISLSGSGNGGGLFAFDGDGICVYSSTNSVSLSYCNSSQKSGVDPEDYQGPLNTFSNISSNGTSGTIVITGLADGATTFFSLEGSPSSINGGGGPVITPEPATFSLIGAGILSVLTLKNRRRGK